MKKLIFWLVSCTWGSLLTVFGALAALGFMIAGCKPKWFYNSIYFEIGKGWGGFNMGPFFFICEDANKGVKSHEAGHGLQNCILGPLTPFIVTIPSVIRYHYIEYMWKKGQRHKIPEYDAIWFEGQATRLGNLYFKED